MVDLNNKSDLSTEASSNMRDRHNRVKSLIQYVKEHGMKLDKKVLLGRFGYYYGVSGSTVYAYLKELEDAEIIFEHAYKGTYWLSLYDTLSEFKEIFDEFDDTAKKD